MTPTAGLTSSSTARRRQADRSAVRAMQVTGGGAAALAARTALSFSGRHGVCEGGGASAAERAVALSVGTAIAATDGRGRCGVDAKASGAVADMVAELGPPLQRAAAAPTLQQTDAVVQQSGEPQTRDASTDAAATGGDELSAELTHAVTVRVGPRVWADADSARDAGHIHSLEEPLVNDRLCFANRPTHI